MEAVGLYLDGLVGRLGDESKAPSMPLQLKIHSYSPHNSGDFLKFHFWQVYSGIGVLGLIFSTRWLIMALTQVSSGHSQWGPASPSPLVFLCGCGLGSSAEHQDTVPVSSGCCSLRLSGNHIPSTSGAEVQGQGSRMLGS